MAVIPNTTTTAQITLEAKEIDFITRFEQNWDALREILGIMRPIRKDPGTKLVASKASVVLQDGNVAEGDEVPLSQATVVPVAYEDLTLEKFRKAVTAEAVAKFGAAIAVQKTDDAFLFELQSKVLDRFYAFAQTGTLRAEYDTFQMALSMAVTLVKDKFKKMRRDFTNIVAFVNTIDVGKYLGAAQISTQTANGIEYLKDFLGANTVIISSEIPQGMVIAIPADNIVLYYIDPGDGDFQELGLNYTTGAGETNLIGIHKEGNYGRVIGETHALMGMKLFAEYVDGIAVVSISGQRVATVPPLTASTLSKPISELIGDDIVVNAKGEVYGTVKEIKKAWTDFDKSNNTGYFFPIELGDKYKDKKITVKGMETASKEATDTEWVLKLKAGNEKDSKFVFSTDDEPDFLTLTFKNVTLQKAAE